VGTTIIMRKACWRLCPVWRDSKSTYGFQKAR